ncbi:MULTISPECIES: DUF4373 domain-containing protein [unclassified Empedobacter]|uniref:DUF4373 domain-containing protein n=1 Tax=unclassified Empedobacter TaxID=2643773 RepID=UPI0025BFA16B|nr:MULTISPECIES: DUF4373 domain-containing protein [unclassified Empedobacter]
MARLRKIGLEYFPLDVSFFENEKIEALSGEFGIKGEITVIKLFCEIYKNGYYLEWNDLQKMKLLKRLPGINVTLLQQILNRLLKWGIFNEEIFLQYGVITSKNIQKQFIDSTKRRKDNSINEYALINVYINDTSTNINVDINTTSSGQSVNKSTQRKVKESKVNNTTEVVLEKSEKILPPQNEDIHIKFCQETLESRNWIDTFLINMKIPKSKNDINLKRLLKEFLNHLILENKIHTKKNEFLSHFTSWCRKLDDSKLKEIYLKKSQPKKSQPKDDYYFLN